MNIGKFSMNGRNLLNVSGNAFLHISKYSHVVTKQTPAEYCFELVRKYDHENFLCTLSLPSKPRSAAFAIRAFNVEVAQIQDQTNDSKIGEMRLKFWTDALNNTFKGNPPRSPVMLELARILQKHSLSKHYFKRLIDARLEYLKNCTFLDMNALEKYAEYSTSSIYYLVLEAYDIHNISADHAASHMEAVFQGQISQDLQNVIYDVACYGKQHLDTAISLKKKLQKNIGLIFLPVVPLEQYLGELRKTDFNVFDKRLQKRNSLLPIYLFWKKLLL
ncbi:NADH dehydrogenase (ubiquinone) complex I, assembly factor 6 homolog sicily isoform X2 [Megalopta genalis]|uniref:NADH dehydrogenase (ubiquinone) complex I, assembly factor 6 homolog sicily isoform X2 n=1 Tax=Megalopta genalis TaxID=115081 RepID=UPI001443698B|nr:NADH dehydrogenase (ubiquinone) complex I, assembly factor 6 [Megalopta genalis]